jgi:hypothetical protein
MSILFPSRGGNLTPPSLQIITKFGLIDNYYCSFENEQTAFCTVRRLLVVTGRKLHECFSIISTLEEPR